MLLYITVVILLYMIDRVSIKVISGRGGTVAYQVEKINLFLEEDLMAAMEVMEEVLLSVVTGLYQHLPNIVIKENTKQQMVKMDRQKNAMARMVKK